MLVQPLIKSCLTFSVTIASVVRKFELDCVIVRILSSVVKYMTWLTNAQGEEVSRVRECDEISFGLDKASIFPA